MYNEIIITLSTCMLCFIQAAEFIYKIDNCEETTSTSTVAQVHSLTKNKQYNYLYYSKKDTNLIYIYI